MAKPTYPATLNSSDALASGLLGWWLLAEGTGTTAHDSSTTGDDGTIASDVSWTTGDGADPVLSFPADAGNQSFVDLGAATTFRPAALTVAVRFRAGSSFTGTWQALFGKGTVFVGWDYTLVFNGSDLRWYVNNSGSYAVFSTTKDAWHTAIATWDGSATQVYIDGTAGTAGSATGTLAGPYHLAIGNGSGAGTGGFGQGDAFGGLLSWAAIWNRVLSSTERSDVVSTPFRPFQAAAAVRIPRPFPWLPAAVLAQ